MSSSVLMLMKYNLAVELIHPVCTRNLCLSAEGDVFYCLILTKGYIERNDFKADDKLLKRHFYCTIACSHREKQGVRGTQHCSPPTFSNTNLSKNTLRQPSGIYSFHFFRRILKVLFFFFACALQ